MDELAFMKCLSQGYLKISYFLFSLTLYFLSTSFSLLSCPSFPNPFTSSRPMCLIQARTGNLKQKQKQKIKTMRIKRALSTTSTTMENMTWTKMQAHKVKKMEIGRDVRVYASKRLKTNANENACQTYIITVRDLNDNAHTNWNIIIEHVEMPKQFFRNDSSSACDSGGNGGGGGWLAILGIVSAS